MNSPIYTKITNNRNVSKTLMLGESEPPVWLDPLSTVIVNYDIWTAADNARRSNIESAVESGDISLALGVRQESGEFREVGYCPVPGNTRVIGSTSIFSTASIHQTSAEKATKLGFTVESNTASDSQVRKSGINTVYAGGDSYKKAASMGLQVEKPGDAGVTVVTKKEEPEVSDTSEKVSCEDLASVRSDFDALCSGKRWADALKLLKDTFGEDKIKCTARSLISAHDFDAILKKYSLI